MIGYNKAAPVGKGNSLRMERSREVFPLAFPPTITIKPGWETSRLMFFKTGCSSPMLVVRVFVSVKKGRIQWVYRRKPYNY